LFRRGAATRSRDLGRVAIGLGLMLFALQQLLALLTPYEDVPSLRLLLGAIATQPVIDVVIAAALTWAAHSSVATVLLTMSLAAQGVVPPQAAFALVLGANLGSALNPLLEGVAGGDPATKRVPTGNLLNRLIGVVLGLVLLSWLGPWLVTIEPNAGRVVADFHTGFNLVMAALFLPLLQPFARLLMQLLPARAVPADPPSRSTLIRRRTRPRRLRWPERPARPCAWPTRSKRCCGALSMRLLMVTANGSARRKGSMTCSTISIGRSRPI
jgi:phosphate:Na+ symporter